MTTELHGKVLTVREVALYLKVHPATIYRLLKHREMPAFKLGGNWRFNIESIDRWRLNQSRLPVAPAAGKKTSTPRTPTPDLHEGDHRGWAIEQARALREHRTEALDWEKLADEIETLGQSKSPRRSPKRA